MKKIKINNKIILESSKPFIVAEAGVNYYDIIKAEDITEYESANLKMIKHIKKVFPDYLVGYSDHPLPDSSMLVLTTAVLLGARVIEKHSTLDKSLKGNDHYHSMNLADLRRFVDNLELLEKIIGKELKEPLESESSARKYARRSLVTKRFIFKGAKITKDVIASKRPGIGISPKDLVTAHE